MIFQILLKTAVISSCSFKYDRYRIAPALLFHFLDDRFKIRKPLDGIVQYLRLAEWCAFLEERLIVAAAFGDIHRDDWSLHRDLLSCIKPW